MEEKDSYETLHNETLNSSRSLEAILEKYDIKYFDYSKFSNIEKIGRGAKNAEKKIVLKEFNDIKDIKKSFNELVKDFLINLADF
ncbi:2205_t:CDS:2 [Gigaspora margarita]|uniref:2205_t:CDS:1 n=1 Tax=Gigaspora margarita TaxID=4874 RepID=A0ABM8W2U6_GIGMA|nr:2205_t:CDS:2 [Gigaspora margarita]